MRKETLVIEFNEVSMAEAHNYAAELKDTLLDSSKEIDVEIKRGAENTQDFGSILVVILGAPAVVAAANALRDWLKFRHSASISIKKPSGSIVIKNLTSKDAELIVDKLQEII